MVINKGTLKWLQDEAKYLSQAFKNLEQMRSDHFKTLWSLLKGDDLSGEEVKDIISIWEQSKNSERKEQ